MSSDPDAVSCSAWIRKQGRLYRCAQTTLREVCMDAGTSAALSCMAESALSGRFAGNASTGCYFKPISLGVQPCWTTSSSQLLDRKSM